ncbi:hypothetical protein HYH03_015933 [Edaphochlamys debaryana]|uniref:Uncharacterized protein n=1 Tax=Edaphochlamys debaryana TaxID=47281 RepID=A0A836BQS9_9CHLO|nr:hypothetical protein HYH03_015933 [Edaphochlamys debaryana]|eukprot:KAG2485352.1 hypothetical protein HYH03_015933 [Edaphochlamys debaryana]
MSIRVLRHRYRPAGSAPGPGLRVQVTQDVYVRLVDMLDEYRFEGAGDEAAEVPGLFGAIVVNLLVAEHPRFCVDPIVDPHDLHTTLVVSFYDYLYGASYTLEHLDGRTLRMEYPAQSAQRVVIVPEHGLLRGVGGGGRGALYEYDELTQAYRREYGPNVVVLFEVGSFYEIYGCDDGARGCRVRDVCAKLNIHATKKNKSLPEVSALNPELAGFPVPALCKYLPILVDDGATVVLVNQVDDGHGKIKRVVTRVVSKGTWVDAPAGADGHAPAHESCLLCICLSCSGCGAALLDVRTGCSHVFEVWPSRKSSMHGALAELASRINGFHVVETLLIGEKPEALDTDMIAPLAASVIHDRLGTPHEFHRPAYQECVLKKVFPSETLGMCSPAEYVRMERHALALTSFVALLDFAYKHDESLVYGLPRPHVHFDDEDESGRPTRRLVTLSPHTLRNLDVLSPDAGCLLRLLDGCVTSSGARLLRARLLQPITDVDEITRRYDATEATAPHAQLVRRELQGTCDVERLQRRLILVTASGQHVLREVPALRETLNRVGGLLGLLGQDVAGRVLTELDECDLAADVDAVLRDLDAAFDDTGAILPGVFEDLDAARERVRGYSTAKEQWLESLRAALSRVPGVSADWLRAGASDEPCAHIVCTLKRFDVISQHLDNVIVLDRGRSHVKFTSSSVRDAARDSCAARDELDAVQGRRLRELQLKIFDTHSSRLRGIANGVALLDLHACIALDAASNAMVRPSLSRGLAAEVSCVQLRHPIVERAAWKSQSYVPNDVDLNKDVGGILLFGVNAAGKSTMCKAVALAVLMAQAGFFVACASMTLVPFGSIYTRMVTRDDIYRGKSTFMVELSELADILHRADARSLVVGDELCSGTESASAVSIVGAACMTLLDRGSHFMFATHLHELPHIKCIREATRVRVYHLSVSYDSATDKLIYDRKLRDGPGKVLYGLEVARAMHLGAEFLKCAHAIRREVLNIQEDLVMTRKSHFNAQVYMDVCGLCKQNAAEETHHILPQKDADVNGFIGHIHKNDRVNLVPLCRQCHDDVHAGRATLQLPTTTI